MGNADENILKPRLQDPTLPEDLAQVRVLRVLKNLVPKLNGGAETGGTHWHAKNEEHLGAGFEVDLVGQTIRSTAKNILDCFGFVSKQTRNASEGFLKNTSDAWRRRW